jgi:tRNA(fMet)-specific endonuclease VapC
MTSETIYLLDTNILVHLVRGKSVGKTLAQNFGFGSSSAQCVITCVSIGEMYSLSRQWEWEQQKLSQLDELIEQVVSVDINHPDIFHSYADIDFLAKLQGRKMGKNDLWIAAANRVLGTTLLTTDGDFDHLLSPNFQVIKIDPHTGNSL